MQNKFKWYLSIGFFLLLVAFVASTILGVYHLNWNDFLLLFQSLFNDKVKVNPTDAYIFFDIRLPRTLLAIIMGSGLAVAGTSLQGMFKNPLATPGIIGITAGSALCAALAIVLGSTIKSFLPEILHYSLISIAAFIGALTVMLLVYGISFKNGKTHVVIMLLGGVAIAALAEATTGFLTFISTDDELRDLTFWRLGSLGAANWPKVILLTIVTCISFFFLLGNGKALNAMMLGEENAKHLGIDIKKHHRKIIWFSSLMVGTSVAFAGTIAFVGLIVPYILRLTLGSDYRIILPLSALFGSLLLLSADIISRVALAPVEIPIGIITAFMGAPVFILILLQFKKEL
ncbi:FecCD family ABC transporter permease [Zunongwangia sp.]|uniref:FecCD family ABC transporter permease n=1 Tax=Zunongwangia sp. TaxID=1965325 RepID=UPI003AA8D3A5